MKQPASHKDIDFGQTLYVVNMLSDKVSFIVAKRKVAAIDKNEWTSENSMKYKYSETFYTKEDAIEYVAAFWGLNVTVK